MKYEPLIKAMAHTVDEIVVLKQKNLLVGSWQDKWCTFWMQTFWKICEAEADEDENEVKRRVAEQHLLFDIGIARNGAPNSIGFRILLANVEFEFEKLSS